MDILITGVNGFLGRELAQSLIKGNHKVIGIGRQSTCKVSGVEYHKIDLSIPQDLSHIIKKCEIIYHLAAITAHNDIVNNTLETEKTSLLSTQNLLIPIINDINSKTFIFASSGKVYGNFDSLPLIESHKANPINLLGKIKRKTEILINEKSNSKDSFFIMRIFNVYGPMQKESFVIPTIIKQLKKQQSKSKYLRLTLGDIEAKRDYIFIDDVIKLFAKISKRSLNPKGTTFVNVGSGYGRSVKDIISCIEGVLQKEIITKIDNNKLRSDELDMEYSSIRKANQLFDWHPQVNLKNGINFMLKHYGLVA
tara:strand:- start:111 stop:1037 length:927 start_codon:yes stop_codon:yes gene_type:complete